MIARQKDEKAKSITTQTKASRKSIFDGHISLSKAVPSDSHWTSRQVLHLQRAIGNTAIRHIVEQSTKNTSIQQKTKRGKQKRSQDFSIVINGVTPIQQPNGMGCWATVATMMASYRDGWPYTVAEIPDVVGRVGVRYRKIFTKKKGLLNADKGPFLTAMGLTAEPPATYLAHALYDMMKSYGPLWVTTDGGSLDTVHARVLIGIVGDGTPHETTMRLIDPADGAIHDETFDVFTRRYGNVGSLDANSNRPFRAQIVHW
jgi:hypothetical protein